MRHAPAEAMAPTLESTPMLVRSPVTVLTIPLSRIRGWRIKVDATIVDVREGRLSFATGEPIRVSRLDTPRGAFFIVDGHHRVIEAVQRGDRTIAAIVDVHIPRIDRTGGAYTCWTSDMVRPIDAVREKIESL